MLLAHYETRLRALGLVQPDKIVSYIEVADWKQHGQFFVARMRVGVNNGEKPEESAYWLKCPYDFFSDLDDVITRKVGIARELQSAGCHIPRTEWFEPGTMIQEEVVGRLVPTDYKKLVGYVGDAVRKEMELYEKAGYMYMDGSGNNFIIDEQGSAWCVDIDFNKVPEKSVR